ncbi:CMD domain protein [Microbacterium sp. A93]|uniref:CMD domain protein n=1 Tax=Microbacterium sp. A93 TaxID=3450716 RepID=UPI003F44402E
MFVIPPDVIDHLAPGRASGLRRDVAREQAQTSFDALFLPVDDSEFTLSERWLISAFATKLTSDDAAAAFYAEGARSFAPDVAKTVLAAAAESATSGPFGQFSEPGLAAESTDGLRYKASDEVFGARIAAALEHSHLLVYRPRETDRDAHERLLEAGWSIDGIVTLSQLVSFLSFQQRVASGLRVLEKEMAA